MAKVQRRIHFYGVRFTQATQASCTCAGSSTMSLQNPAALDLLTLDSLGPKPAGRLRGRFHLPSNQWGVPVLEPGLAHPTDTHFALFENANVLGVEFNPDGPRFERWCGSLASALPSNCMVDVKLLLHGHLYRHLARVTRKTHVHVGVYPDRLANLQELDAGLHETFATLHRQNPHAGELQVTLELGSRRENQELAVTWLPLVPGFLSNMGHREIFSQLELGGLDGETGQPVDVDLLDDQMIPRRQVMAMDDASHAVVSASVYHAIEAAFDKLARLQALPQSRFARVG